MPRSRVDLLDCYLAFTYERRSNEADAELHFEPYSAVVIDWAELAYLITREDYAHGVSRSTSSALLGWTESRWQRCVTTASRCGLLNESFNPQNPTERLISFENHRLQEYLAALHLLSAAPSINWMEKVDALRWQEVLVNLVASGGGRDAISTLLTKILEPISGFKSEIESYEAKRAKLPNSRKQTQLKFDPVTETLLAERVEVLARIFEENRGSEDVSAFVTPCLQEAIDLLVAYGNPVTQYRMIYAAIRTRDPVTLSSAARLLHSNIRWVQGQALILLSGTGAKLPLELRADLCDSVVLSRLDSYVQAIRKTPSGSAVFCLIAASLCNVGQWLAFLCGSLFLYYNALAFLAAGKVTIQPGLTPSWLIPLENQDLFNLQQAIPEWTFDFPVWATVAAHWMLQPIPLEIGISIIALASIEWLESAEDGVTVTTFAAALLLLLPVWAYGTWTHPWLIFLPVMVVLCGGFTGVLVFGPLCFAGLRWFFLLTYVTLTLPFKTAGSGLSLLLARIWEESDGPDAWSFGFSAILPILFFAFLSGGLTAVLLIIVGAATLWLLTLAIKGVARLRKTRGILAALLATAKAVAVRFAAALSPNKERRRREKASRKFSWKQLAKDLGRLLGGVAVVGLVGVVDFRLVQPRFPLGSFLFPYVFLGCGVLLFCVGGALVAGGEEAFRWIRHRPRAQVAVEIVLGVTGLLLAYFLLRVCWWAASAVWTHSATPITRLILIVVACLIVLAVLADLRGFYHFLRGAIAELAPSYAAGKFTPDEWMEMLRRSVALEQRSLLNRTTNESMRMSEQEFLRLLEEAEGAIQREPALSTYWKKRADLQQEIRQSRRG